MWLTLGVPGAPDVRQGAPLTTPPASVRSLNLSLRISGSRVCERLRLRINSDHLSPGKPESKRICTLLGTGHDYGCAFFILYSYDVSSLLRLSAAGIKNPGMKLRFCSKAHLCELGFGNEMGTGLPEGPPLPSPSWAGSGLLSIKGSTSALPHPQNTTLG